MTSHIGLIATASTTYNDPFNLARRFASLDHISGGRAGWNIVTTATQAAAQNFGLDEVPGHGERYQRAAEFVDVSVALWDSWEDGAEIGDKAAGRYADPARIHPVDFAGEYFRVRGPLNVPRSPQGRPLLVQAGSSDDGREFAARYAEAVFTAQQTLADAQEFYADLKRRARRRGRDPADQDPARPGPGHRLDRGRGPRTRRPNWRSSSSPNTAWLTWPRCSRCRRTRWRWTARFRPRYTPARTSRARRAATS